MPNVFNSVKPKANPSHNAFDLSHRDVFSAKPGMLIPMFLQHTYPESTFHIKHLSLMRTSAIQSPAFARMNENFEYFFVPYSQLWKDFERFYYERGDIQRNNLNVVNPSLSSYVPMFDLSDVLRRLAGAYYCDRVFDAVLTYWGSMPSEHVVKVTPFELQRRIDIMKHTKYTQYFEDIFGRHCVEDMLRNLDMLGYGNYLPKFKEMIDGNLFAMYEDTNDNYTSRWLYDSPSSLPFLRAMWAEDFDYTQAQLQYANVLQDWDQGIFNEATGFEVYLSGIDNIFPNVLSLAAYLKIWSDYYRNSTYDVDNYSYWYNFDYVVNNSTNVVPTDKILELLKPRYRQWKKDRVTGSYPTAQFGSVAVANLNNPTVIMPSENIVLGPNNTSPRFSYDIGHPLSYQLDGNDSYSPSSNSWNIDSSISAIAIRESLALQRYKERILRAGNRLTSLQTALFGDKSRFIENNYCDLISAQHSAVDINQVAATAESGDTNVGELSANGVGVHGGKEFSYHSHDFGIIIGMYYVLPESEYDAFSVDPFNQKSEPYDYFKPDFENLGFSPIYSYDVNYPTNANEQKVFGYLPRYWEYKTAVDKVHGEFYSSFGTSLPNERNLAYIKGSFADFVTPRNAYDLSNRITLANLYVNPNCIDNIFYVSPDERQSSDPFKVNSYHEVKAILPMSVLGLPTF